LILGSPAEIYTEGTQYFIYVFGIMLACLLAAQLFVPLLYPLKLTSSFEVSNIKTIYYQYVQLLSLTFETAILHFV
jgi:hypothetical protein